MSFNSPVCINYVGNPSNSPGGQNFQVDFKCQSRANDQYFSGWVVNRTDQRCGEISNPTTLGTISINNLDTYAVAYFYITNLLLM